MEFFHCLDYSAIQQDQRDAKNTIENDQRKVPGDFPFEY